MRCDAGARTGRVVMRGCALGRVPGRRSRCGWFPELPGG